MSTIEETVQAYSFPTEEQFDTGLEQLRDEFVDRFEGMVEPDAIDQLWKVPEVREAARRLAQVLHAAARLDERFGPMLELADEASPGWAARR